MPVSVSCGMPREAHLTTSYNDSLGTARVGQSATCPRAKRRALPMFLMYLLACRWGSIIKGQRLRDMVVRVAMVLPPSILQRSFDCDMLENKLMDIAGFCHHVFPLTGRKRPPGPKSRV